MQADLSRMFRYEAWANREELARFRAIATPERAVGLLAHIVGTQWVWYARLHGQKPKMAVWPPLTRLDQFEPELRELAGKWESYLATRPSGAIEYTNSKGEKWKSEVIDVLTHVVMHGTYHRGQIATVLRDAGIDPAYTDFIQAARIGAV